MTSVNYNEAAFKQLLTVIENLTARVEELEDWLSETHRIATGRPTTGSFEEHVFLTSPFDGVVLQVHLAVARLADTDGVARVDVAALALEVGEPEDLTDYSLRRLEHEGLLVRVSSTADGRRWYEIGRPRGCDAA